MKYSLVLLALTLLTTEALQLAYTLRGQDPPLWTQSLDHIFNCISHTVTVRFSILRTQPGMSLAAIMRQDQEQESIKKLHCCTPIQMKNSKNK